MSKSFMAIGECMVEMAPQDGGLYAMAFAGDTFNTAYYARSCLPKGWDVGYLTAVGTDSISDRMVSFIADQGISTKAIARLDGKTVGLYMIELKGAERSFSYWRSASAARSLADQRARLDRMLSGVDVAYLSGITLAILSDDARVRLAEALLHAKENGTVVAFDPNLRPKLWSDKKTMCAAVMQMSAISDIVLPSHEDEATWFDDESPLVTAERYASVGAGVVVVKDGPGQVLCMKDGSVTRFTPPRVEHVVDTTAAGDSFNAGFLAAYLQGGDLEAAMRLGAAVAGRVISARGALVKL